MASRVTGQGQRPIPQGLGPSVKGLWRQAETRGRNGRSKKGGVRVKRQAEARGREAGP
jgi:hypothetical protein